MFTPRFSFLPGTTHLQLQASPAAAKMARHSRKQPCDPQPPLKPTNVVEAEARSRVFSLGGDPADRCWLLSQMELQFGQYRGQTFQWLLTNDLGYTVEVLESHSAEHERGEISSNTPLTSNKDALLEYARLFPEISAAMSDKRTGTQSEDDRLVGFGTYSSLTCRELYESKDKEVSSYRGFVRGLTLQNAGSQLSQLKQYVLRRDRESKTAACPTASKTAASSSAASTTSSSARVSFSSRAAAATWSSRVTRAPSSSPSPPSSPRYRRSTPRKKRALVLQSSSEEEDRIMVEAAADAEEDVSSSASFTATLPSPPPPSAPPAAAPLRPAALSSQIVMSEAWKKSLPPEQHEWLSKALFVRDQTGRAVLTKELQLWYYPPGPRLVYHQRPTSPDAFFQRPFFLWAPYRMWQYLLKCPCCECKLTSCGLYKTVRRVLDMNGWYYIGTEYLECRFCRKKVASWSRSVVEQLSLSHQLLFPAVLAYRLSVDKKVLSQLKGRTLGNSSSRLRSLLVESHTEEWMRRSLHYLQTYKQFEVPGVQLPPPPPPPTMPQVPSCSWLLSIYARSTFSRLEELKAGVTSIFGSILKMESTKKVTRKLAGVAAGTAECMTSVGNELGQVLISVLTSAEEYGLQDMATGLQERYRQANRDPPEVLYVDRDCCRAERGTFSTASLFPTWPQLQVKLDIRHFIHRLAVGVTTVTHPLYPEFMRRISACIFEWDPEDMARLKTAKQAERSRRGNDLTLKEMARHCRRRTRSAQETERLLDETIKVFMGLTDTMGTPLLDQARMKDIWRTERRHITCIQDPPGVRLYTRTGQLTKGGVVLPVYRCARGSTSLESFHLHLNRFIPGTSANDCYFQVFLLEGLTRWNEDRAQAAAGADRTGMKCYAGQMQHTLSQLTQQFMGVTLAECYSKPLKYTGELIGVGYLYAQTGRVLQSFSEDTDEELTLEEEADDDDEKRMLDLEDDLDGDNSQMYSSQHPTAPSQHPTASSQHPTASSQHPTASSQHPTAPSQHPTASSQHPTASSQHPTASSQHPTAPSQHPTAPSQHPTAPSQHPTAPSQHPTASSQHPTASSQHPTASSQHPTAPPQHPTAPPQHPTGSQPVAGPFQPPAGTSQASPFSTSIPAGTPSQAAGSFLDIDSITPKSSAWHRKQILQLQEEAARRGETIRVRPATRVKCSKCGQRKIKETGHRLLRKASGERVHYCHVAAEGKSAEEWLHSLP